MDFAAEMLHTISVDMIFLNRVFLPIKNFFLTIRKVNENNVRILGIQRSHFVRELERESTKVNVCCCISFETLIVVFFSNRIRLLAPFI